MTRSLSLALAATTGLVLVACTAAESPSQAPGDASAAGAGEAQTVEVSLTEFQIDMPTSIAAGPVTFDVSNDGAEIHGFEVEGNGIEEEIEELAAGEAGTLEVDLEPGTYEVYCPVDDHRGMGMELELEVE
jgi:plastocyanin